MKIAVIGCGFMGSALAERLSSYHELFLFDRNLEKMEKLASSGIGVPCNLKEALKSAEVAILAIKPQQLSEMTPYLKLFKKNLILFSLLAGVTLAKLKTYFTQSKIIRLMPNLPILAHEGVIALSTQEAFLKEEKELLGKLFTSFSQVFWLEEDKINAETALASCGPAYFFSLYEAMVEAGIFMGLKPKEAEVFIRQMLKGSLAMLETSNLSTTELKWQIASPKGATIAGLVAFEEESVRSGIINTFLAAFDRINELNEE